MAKNPSFNSPYFTYEEFTRSGTAARLKIDNTPNGEHIQAMRALVKHVLQPLRIKFGPIRISSGYRSPELCKAIGSSARSRHTLGQAADIKVRKSISGYVEIAWYLATLPTDAFIIEKLEPNKVNRGWIHVSYDRKRKKPRRKFQTYAHDGYVDIPRELLPPKSENKKKFLDYVLAKFT